MKKIKVLIVRPGEEPEEAMIEETLPVLRSIVGGHIEHVKPPSHRDDVAILCNEDGKYNGSMPNKPIFDEDMGCFDIIYGTFIICRHPANSIRLDSMTEEQVRIYKEMYR